MELLSAAKQLARLKQPSEDNFFHLGKLAEAKGDLDEATKYYAEGIAVETPRKNPCEEAIRRLYVKRQGSLDGFEDYAEQFRKENREKRKARVLAGRIQQPEPIEAFSLKTLAIAPLSRAFAEKA